MVENATPSINHHAKIPTISLEQGFKIWIQWVSHTVMPRYGMDTLGICNGHGKDMDFTHKK